MTKTILLSVLVFITMATNAKEIQAEIEGESKEAFISRVLNDNCPPLSEENTLQSIEFFMFSMPSKIIRDPNIGQVKMHEVKPLKRLQIEQVILDSKLHKICGKNKKCRLKAQQCAGKVGYIEDNKIKSELHQCINALE